ncbi:CPBP family intramembrane glutamic endopeptidase [Cohnella zeiphila]|uniref:CPBP family intramembrane metalloprotease n=1 Tax=Cohnella zeiphila TaxID=2761120 RepID=A0A7X0SM73_9BACL|nr:CPBP family intramembrane glutamic endopeptidase [Cohnella zeiphila]MBB6732511.1 CPBP family intramembrane metalloprotease [Cohnella zeiphila]
MFTLRWFMIACVGFLAFLTIQVFPSLESFATSPQHRVMDREKAKELALQSAANRWKILRSDVNRIQLTHVSDSSAVGYLEKTKLTEDYDKAWDDLLPTDVYRADLWLNDGSLLQLSLQMESGKTVAWRWLEDGSGGRRTGRMTAEDTIKSGGFDPARWTPTGAQAEDGAMVYRTDKTVGEATPELLVKPGAELLYRLSLPESFTAYLADQKSLASRMSAIGFLLPQIVLFVLAVAYAIACRKWTSFKRGRTIAVIYFLLYFAFTLNMTAGFRSQSGKGLPVDDATVYALLIANGFILAGTALVTYFAAVAGSGLWKRMGRSLWARWAEADYGRTIMRGVRQGYALAFILLGAQSVILVGLDRLAGTFSASDASQSPYNLTFSWLMPMIAWCAALSEETLYRLFGIGLLRGWLLSGARLVLRREPSPRAASLLTLAAMVPPSVTWAFGHVGYPIYPVYSRLIELTILGVLLGWFMLRFGLIAVFFAHAALDATLVGMQLLFDGLPYDWVSGLFSIALPALAGGAISLAHRWRHRGGDPALTPRQA